MKKRVDQSVQSSSKTARVKTIQAVELKSLLVKRLNAEYACLSPRLVYQAVNEADALASLTSVPLLVLPALAEEKVQKAAAWSVHQQSVLRGDFLAFAA